MLPSSPLLLPEAGDESIRTERIHALDVLRAGAMMLGIYLHGAISFMVTEIPWVFQDPQTHVMFDISVAVIHGFRMQLFFVLAGFFANLVCQRIGVGAFLRRRAVRIGVPFVIGLTTVLPLTLVAWVWGAQVSGQPADQPITQTGRSLLDYPTGHLWFLEYLLAFYAITAICLKLPLQRISTACISIIRHQLGSRWKPFFLMFLTTPFLLTGPQIGEPESPGLSLRVTINAIGYYGAFFWFGWILFHCRSALGLLQRYPMSYAIIALIAFLGYGASVDELIRHPESHTWAFILFGNIASGIYTWSMIFLVSGLTLRFFSKPMRWSSYWADASYWFYLAHLPLVIALQVVVFRWHLNPFAKCAFVCTATTAILWITYHYCVRYTFVGTILNGLRKRALT